MTSHFHFGDREGSTPLDEAQKKGLKYSHITNLKELDEVEESNILKGLEWESSYKGTDYLSENFLLQLHKKLFGDVWSWAGEYRKIEIPKNLSPFHFSQVPAQVREFFLDFQERVKSGPANWNEFAAEFHHRLVSIHPFPNGNGRTTRIYTEYILERNKQPPPIWKYGVIKVPEERRTAYLKALQAADKHDYHLLVEFMFSK